MEKTNRDTEMEEDRSSNNYALKELDTKILDVEKKIAELGQETEENKDDHFFLRTERDMYQASRRALEKVIKDKYNVVPDSVGELPEQYREAA